MSKIRNLLLIGRTGQGKSSLANVIVGEENKFPEGEFGVSKTKKIQVEEFEHQGTKYRIIDTTGIGDTELSQEEVLSSIAKVCDIIEEDGLSQVLFVSGGRFTREEIEAFNTIRLAIFNNDVTKYTTIVRTKFENFEDKQKCRMDCNKLLGESESIREVIESCKRKIVYVNNPPINSKERNKEIRKDSRKILLDYLANCQGTYKPTDLRQVKKKIGNYVAENEGFKRRMGDLEKEMLRQRNQMLVRQLEEMKEKKKENDEQLKRWMMERSENERQKIIDAAVFVAQVVIPIAIPFIAASCRIL